MKSLFYLIGYRGAGKTTVGGMLAERLGWSFVDADVFLEAQSGRSIKEIFATEGEPVFRDMESSNLRELSRRERCVIATGGGIILREENRKLLRDTGYVVWLTADPQTTAERLQNDPLTSGRRPDLSVGGLAEIAEMLRLREPHYRSCADLEIATAGRSPEMLAEAILTQWHSSTQDSSRSSS